MRAVHLVTEAASEAATAVVSARLAALGHHHAAAATTMMIGAIVIGITTVATGTGVIALVALTTVIVT
jgi:hypothetical protein